MFTLEEMLTIEHIAVENLSPNRVLRIRRITTDSRNVKPGDAFVAIRGERFDGNRFVDAAVERGAVCAIVNEGLKHTKLRVPLIRVKDTTRALGELARLHRRKFDIPVIAITGSSGKTTTKEMVHSVLKTKYNVLSTKGNLNNHIGVPQTLFRLKKNHEVAVIEMGMNHVGEIHYLCEMAEPTHGVVTNIGKAHLGYFKSIEQVAEAKGELFDWIAERGERVGFINMDDSLVVRQSKKVRNKITYSCSRSRAAMQSRLERVDAKGQPVIELTSKGWKKPVTISMRIAGIHNISNVTAAAAIGKEFGISPGEIQSALQNFKPVSGRLEVSRISGVTIVNDAYNANPESVMSALETIASMDCRGRRIVVLGDMLELGTSSRSEHKHIGAALLKFQCDMLLTVGTYTKHLNNAAKIKEKIHYDDKRQLIQQLSGSVQKGDVVLIKGSHGMRMDEVVNELVKYLKPKT